MSSLTLYFWYLALVIPAAYHASKNFEAEPFNNGTIPIYKGGPPNPDDGSLQGLLTISRGTAILLLLIYIAYLFFQLKTHADFFVAPGEAEEAEEPQMNAVSAGLSLLTVTVVTSFCADYREPSVSFTNATLLNVLFLVVASIEETSEKWHIVRCNNPWFDSS